MDWIDASEPPEHPGYAFVRYAWGDGGAVLMAHWDGRAWRHHRGGPMMTERVTHWQPVRYPDPPA